jgi:hypothetical protein
MPYAIELNDDDATREQGSDEMMRRVKHQIATFEHEMPRNRAC